MKIFWFTLSLFTTIFLIYILNTSFKLGDKSLPKLGSFLSPQKGFWANAEPSDKSFNQELQVKGLLQNTDVFFDERLVPHIYASNHVDAMFLQGYLHAKFRLWQMEFQTHIAAGRLSEIRGKDSAALVIDKFFRRLGMVYAAENCLKTMEKDSYTKQTIDAYTAGVNYYINNMKEAEMPIEYKLMNYKPEPWTNLKIALFLKLMSFDLTGQDDDIVYTNGKNVLGFDNFKKIFPNFQDSLDPIIPKGTVFQKPSIQVKVPTVKDSVYQLQKLALAVARPYIADPNNGSNNWAVDSSKTKSKKPILCNDPHLNLSLPSLWYEMQITTPQYSTYGATFPGSPAVIIGFNNNIAWGVTNAGRDVKDYYELKFKDDSMQEYWFNNSWQKATIRNEIIKVKNDKDIIEKLAITNFGIVMYDKSYKSKNKDEKYIAVRWTAHDESNELQTFLKLNLAKNYTDYKQAISTFVCPGQNFVFASKQGDVAITQEGKFVAKWEHQGDFVMPGIDSNFMWQGFIPENENPTQHNPPRGFVSSANQKAVDETYPYYLGRAANFPLFRGLIINRKLQEMNNISVTDMMNLQNDNYDVFAEMLRPILLYYIDENNLKADDLKLLESIKDWNLTFAWDEKAATLMNIFYHQLDEEIYSDEFSKTNLSMPHRLQSALVQNLLADTSFSFIDNILTTKKESLREVVNTAFLKTTQKAKQLEKENILQWGKYRKTAINHRTNIVPFCKQNLTTNGSGNCINATRENNGPSWKMIVHLTNEIEAYGVYPGGQNGNPGSKYYDNFIETWVNGKYNSLIFVNKENAVNHPKFKWKLTCLKT